MLRDHFQHCTHSLVFKMSQRHAYNPSIIVPQSLKNTNLDTYDLHPCPSIHLLILQLPWDSGSQRFTFAHVHLWVQVQCWIKWVSQCEIFCIEDWNWSHSGSALHPYISGCKFNVELSGRLNVRSSELRTGIGSGLDLVMRLSLFFFFFGWLSGFWDFWTLGV